jgi:hypothetical protein
VRRQAGDGLPHGQVIECGLLSGLSERRLKRPLAEMVISR